MKPTLIAGMVLASWALAPTALAQAPLALSLEDAVARGVAHAPVLGEAQAREAAAEAAVASRVAQGRPLLTASTGVLRTNHVPEFGLPQAGGGIRVIFPDLPNNYDARMELTVPVYTAGRVDALVAAARADDRAAGLDRRAVEADVALDVARAYWTLVMARDSVGVLERALERADATVADVRARVDAGVLPPNDLLSAQAQRARQNVLLIEARNADALAEADLARAVGAPPGQPIQTTTPADVPTPGVAELTAQPIAALVAQATSGRAERQALLSRQAALTSSEDAVLAATRPQLSARAAFEPARPNPRFVPRVDEWNQSWDLGVTLTWAVWDAGRAQANRAGLAAQADGLRARIDRFDEGVALEIRQRSLDLASTEAALAAADEGIAAATEAQRVVNERFAAGVVTNTELLDAEVARLQAELDRARLEATLRFNEARLLRAVRGR